MQKRVFLHQKNTRRIPPCLLFFWIKKTVFPHFDALFSHLVDFYSDKINLHKISIKVCATSSHVKCLRHFTFPESQNLKNPRVFQYFAMCRSEDMQNRLRRFCLFGHLIYL